MTSQEKYIDQKATSYSGMAKESPEDLKKIFEAAITQAIADMRYGCRDEIACSLAELDPNGRHEKLLRKVDKILSETEL